MKASQRYEIVLSWQGSVTMSFLFVFVPQRLWGKQAWAKSLTVLWHHAVFVSVEFVIFASCANNFRTIKASQRLGIGLSSGWQWHNVISARRPCCQVIFSLEGLDVHSLVHGLYLERMVWLTQPARGRGDGSGLIVIDDGPIYRQVIVVISLTLYLHRRWYFAKLLWYKSSSWTLFAREIYSLDYWNIWENRLIQWCATVIGR